MPLLLEEMAPGWCARRAREYPTSLNVAKEVGELVQRERRRPPVRRTNQRDRLNRG